MFRKALEENVRSPVSIEDKIEKIYPQKSKSGPWNDLKTILKQNMINFENLDFILELRSGVLKHPNFMS